MGCQQSVPAAVESTVDAPKDDPTADGAEKHYKGVGASERMVSRARRMAEEKKRAQGKAVAGNGNGKGAGKDEPKVNELGHLVPEEVVRRTDSSVTNSNATLGRPGCDVQVQYAYQTQRGYYPDDPHKANQDAFSVSLKFAGEPRDAMLAVYDGHGVHGHSCARHARKRLPALVEKYVRQVRSKLYRKELRSQDGHKGPGFDPRKWPFLNAAQFQDCCSKAFLECNEKMHADVKCQDKMSGTTAVAVLFHGNLVTVANVGDSRVVLGRRSLVDTPAPPQSAATATDTATGGGESSNNEEEEKTEISSDLLLLTEEEQHQQQQAASVASLGVGGDSNAETSCDSLLAIPLSRDQTPYRKDERERVRARGAVVMSMDQMEGLEEVHDDWGDLVLGKDVDLAGDPPRVWADGKEYPGAAFTRSIGDSLAEAIGVTAEPELLSTRLTAADRVLVIASDGIFEFLTNQRVIDICSRCETPLIACRELVKTAYEQWLVHEKRTDDITVIVCFLSCSGLAPGSDGGGDGSNTPPVEGTTEDLVALAHATYGSKPVVQQQRKSNTGKHDNLTNEGAGGSRVAERFARGKSVYKKGDNTNTIEDRPDADADDTRAGEVKV